MNLPTDDLTALAERVWGSFIGRCMHRFIRMEGFDRSLVLASQAFTALIPMLIVVAALAPAGWPELIGRTIITKFGLTGTSAAAVEQLFAVSGVAESTASVGSALLLIYSGVSFTRRLSKMYRAAWNQEKAGVRGNLFAALGLFVFVGGSAHRLLDHGSGQEPPARLGGGTSAFDPHWPGALDVGAVPADEPPGALAAAAGRWWP